MTKQKYLEELKRFLFGLPAEEREQALKYYEDYFEDAGEENEASVIEELGNPAVLAKQIMNTNHDFVSYGSSFETAENAPAFFNPQNTGSQTAGQNQSNYDTTNQNTAYRQNTEKKSWTQDSGKVALVIILAILAIPVGLPLLGSLFGITLSVIAVVIALLISIFAIGFAFAVSGIFLTVVAATSFSISIPGGLLVLGISLILLSLGIAIIWFSVVFCTKFLPSFFKAIGKAIRSITGKIKSAFS